MSEQYQDEQQEVIGDGETPEEYSASRNAAATAVAAEEKKKKDRLLKLGIVGVAVLVGGSLIYGKVSSKNAESRQRAEEMLAKEKAEKATKAQEAQMLADKKNEKTPEIVLPVGAQETMPSAAGSMLAQPMAPEAQNVAAPEPKREGLDRAIEELKGTVGEIHSMFKKIEELNVPQRLQALEETVAAMEARRLEQERAEQAAKEQVALAKEEKAKAAAKKKMSGGSDNKKVVDGSVIKPLKIEGVVEPKPPKVVLQAVIPGRAWFKMQDGTSHNFVVGETLPDGSKILHIEAEQGKVVTSKGVHE